MKRFIEGEDCNQSTLFPECLEDYVTEDNPVRVIDVFVDELDLGRLGFGRVDPKVTGRPAYHPSMLLKLYIYAYLNRVQSSRRIEREAQRNVELMWLTERLSPDHKTIADFRKDNSKAIRRVCREFVILCRRLNLFTQALVVIDGSKFKAVNNRDRNFTRAKMKRHLAQIEASLDRYFEQLERADREESSIAEDKAVVATKNIIPTDFVDFFTIAVIRSRHENYRPPPPVHPARTVPKPRPLTPRDPVTSPTTGHG